MKEELKKLAALQEVDVEIDALSDECEFIPALVEKKKAVIEQGKKKLNDERVKSKELQVKHKSLEMDLSASEEKIKKQKMDLNSVKTNEQYRMLQREIESAEEDRGAIEDNVLRAMSEIDEFNARLRETEKTTKTEEDIILSEINGLMSQKADCEQKLSVRRNEREKLASGIPAAILKKYEHIRKNLEDGIAVAQTHGNNCGVCGMKLPPQVINEVTKDEGLVFCENCSRILYLPNDLLNEKEGEGRKAAPRENRGEESPNSHSAEKEISVVKG